MKASILIVLFCLIIFNITASDLTVKITSLPENHDFSEIIFLAGSINGWDAGDEDYQMELSGDSAFYSIVLSGEGEMQFKFTKGSWETVEKGNGCAEIGNRTATFGQDTIYEASIINWADQCGANNEFETNEENVSILYNDFYIPQFDRNRRIWAYLPPDYETSNESYPVIYMHDGQNLFDSRASFAGEWQIDESLNELIEDGLPASIVIGIDNGSNFRIDELTPWSNKNYGGGDGDKYMQFIVETLKPHIDSTLRTLPDRANTGLLGSSLGGLVSFYGALAHPEVFSKIGVFSPSFWFSDSSYVFASEHDKAFDMKMYFVAGGNEGSGGQVVNDCIDMMDTLKNVGFGDDEMRLAAKDDGTHSEWFWRREFPDAYRWLWGYEPLPVNERAVQMEIFPNPASDTVFIQLNNATKEYNVSIRNLSGKKIYQAIHSGSSCKISTEQLKSGIYIIQCLGADFQLTKKILIRK